MNRLFLALTAIPLVLCACDEESSTPGATTPDAGVTAPDAGAMTDMGTVSQPDMVEQGLARPSSWSVIVAQQAPGSVKMAANDVVKYFTAMGQEATLVEAAQGEGTECPAQGAGAIVFVGDEVGQFDGPIFGAQTWGYQERECDGGGALISLTGGGVLGRQYAAYEWLHQLGVRFFHPEQEFVPAAPRWPAERMNRKHTPDFEWRSASLHLTHPLELGDVFKLGKPEYEIEGKRYIDWQLKNGASYGHTELGNGRYKDYGTERGLPRAVGFPLYSQQQGDDAVYDPDDPRPATEQIAAAIDEAMGEDPAKHPKILSFTFNPSEFTELDDQVAVEQLTFISEYMAQRYPDTLVQTTNHAVTGEPTEHYGVRYFDLSKFAPENLGVRVHTVMFYDLFRPAPVYGNENFNYAYDFMLDQYQERQLWHYPESAWWLTFDNALPMYLPITIEARDRDIQGIAFMLQGKLDGHRIFGSGHEWGYWQNEYCSFRMAADIAYRYTDCLEDIAWAAGEEAAPVVTQVLKEAIAYQERDLIYGKILPYLVGTDPETEIAQSIGIFFHPLPPAPQQIMGWDLEQVRYFEQAIAPALVRMDQDYHALLSRLDAVRSGVPEAGLPWFDEIYDGLEVTALRARHGEEVYGAAVVLRKSQLLMDPAMAQAAADKLERARETTQEAIAVVHRREKGYRYLPIERSIAGGPDGTEDENWTIYKFRVHNRTHHGYYYTRIDDLVQQAFDGSAALVSAQDTLLGPGQALEYAVRSEELEGLSIDFGDGQTSQLPSGSHQYDAPGLYTLRVSATRAGQPVEFEGLVAVVLEEENLGFRGKISQPRNTQIIEPVLPAMVLGAINEVEGAIGFSASEDGKVPLGLVSKVSLEPDAQSQLKTQPQRLLLPVVNRPTESVSTSMLVEAVVIERTGAGQPVVVTGNLSTDAVVNAVVSVGGFDRNGARQLVASILGYQPSTLPSTVPFILRYLPQEME